MSRLTIDLLKTNTSPVLFIDKIFEIETDANGEIVAVNYKAGDMYKESGLSTDQIKAICVVDLRGSINYGY